MARDTSIFRPSPHSGEEQRLAAPPGAVPWTAGTPAAGVTPVYLSPPHMGGREQELVAEAFASNWIAPLGPFVARFEEEFAARVGVAHALALSSGTAALHLALMEAGVGRGDEVLVSTFTFAATVNPILYVGATPVLIDSEPVSWNMDPGLLEDALVRRAAAGRLPKAVILVHLYGQTADLDAIVALCERYGVTLIEDAAEALGASYRGRAPGGFGRSGVFSFNGNKIITTSGGGMLVSDDGDLIAHARKLATQARDLAPHYEHSEIGYNYRLSNILAAIGVAQLEVLEDRVQTRRRNFDYYRVALADLPGIEFMPEAPWGRHTRWLTCITVDPAVFGADREAMRLTLEARGIEARPLWKPMHMQPVYARYESVGGRVSESLFERGLCLPSGSSLTSEQLERVVDAVHETVRNPTRAFTPGIELPVTGPAE
ncbi:MAG TPA: aminotransferase class I/II-fold pyridoxal phosphate-dependent enzyme [Longimicrobium sp.]|nr:aminotransferase class I/II-fold pyridoxal phosphate-dependent enzyme [Longimicrobium sp.]